MNSHQLYLELKTLTDQGYLEAAQLARIEEEYLKNRKDRRGIFLIFALLGVLFIGAGVISLFAYNWSMFPRELKAFVAFLPLLGVQCALLWALRTGASEMWTKSLTLALGIAFLAALGLIYQAYQLSYSLRSVMMAGFLLMLPVVYLLDGYYLAVLYMAGVCWAGNMDGQTLPVLLLLPYCVRRVREGGNCALLCLCFFIWLPCLAVRYAGAAAFPTFLLILFLYKTVKTPTLFPRLSSRLLYGLLFLKAVFRLEYMDLFEFMSPGRALFYLPHLIPAVLLSAAAVMALLIWKNKEDDRRIDLAVTAALCGLLAVEIRSFAFETVVNLCFIAYSLYRLMCGVKQANLSSVRRYTAALILYILLKVLFGSYALIVKGLVFLAAGIAFLAVNGWMSFRLKGGKSHEK